MAQVRPLIFSFREQSAIKDCFKMLQKKVEYEIIQEFMVNIFVLKKSICDFFFYITTREFFFLFFRLNTLFLFLKIEFVF